MTAHVRYSAIDAEHPATTSPAVIDEVIRGAIGFDGLLMSDDISMKALSGSLGERTTAALAAGCDLVLHCNGVLAEMEAVAANVLRLEGRTLARLKTALAVLQRSEPFEQQVAQAAIARVLSVSV
jgi:beta-N-acetylhexosaminidase